MLFLIISILPFFLLLSKSLPLQPLPSWTSEVRLLSVEFLRELFYFSVRSVAKFISRAMSSKRMCGPTAEETSVLDLPELALDLILEKLPPSELCNMAGVCREMKDRCRSDYLWERHMREKWGRVIGQAARREWEWYLSSRKEAFAAEAMESGAVGKPNRWIVSLASVWPLSWLKSKLDVGCKPESPLPQDSIMSWYMSLESGRFWFPAQVYNREVSI